MTALGELVGVELGPSSWVEVTQERIDAFAAATEDPQWIHVDAERAAAGPFGTTVAHGFLTLSLCIPAVRELLPPSGGAMINYGVDRVRFPAPVPAGARIRGRLRVASLEPAGDGERALVEARIECEGVEKPVCVADLVLLTLP